MGQIRLITENVLGEFEKLVNTYRNDIYRITIISPWIGSEESRYDPLRNIVEILSKKVKRNYDFQVFTRQPTEAWHSESIEFLNHELKPTIWYCKNLHTKLYILECDGFHAAIIGSPNLTSKANRQNLELAVEFRSIKIENDDTSRIINELSKYAFNLRGEDGVSLK